MFPLTVLLSWISSGGASLALPSPGLAAFSPDGTVLAVLDSGRKAVAFLETSSGKLIDTIKLDQTPLGLCWGGNSRDLFITAPTAGLMLCCGRRPPRPFAKVGLRPAALAWAPRRNLLLVGDEALRAVYAVPLRGSPTPKRLLGLPGIPSSLAVDPTGEVATCVCLAPTGDATSETTSTCAALFDLPEAREPVLLRLPPGSTNARQSAFSPDGRWLFIAHTIGRIDQATEQLEGGWTNTNAISVLDVRNRKWYCTFLLDQLAEGLADPWGVVVSPGGKYLWVGISGRHTLLRIKLTKVMNWARRSLATYSGTGRAAQSYRPPSADEILGPASANRLELIRTLRPPGRGSGLFLAHAFERLRLPGKGPRSIALSPKGRLLAVPLYFSGSVALVDTRTLHVVRTIPLGGSAEQPPLSLERLGEEIFHDADRCYQGWLSCATCHPGGRSDGLNWDLLNDGIGNPKNARSLVFSYLTPPLMARGVRSDLQEAVRAGFHHILFTTPTRKEVKAVAAYLRALKPVANPFLRDPGRVSAILRGKKLFESPRTGCSSCHPPPLYTDLKMHDVGTRGESDEASAFDTPALVELWRTPPYLHNGKAATLREVLTSCNPRDRHGRTSELSDRELSDLEAFLLSL